MDVHCSTCNEPWDTDHLWFDEIFECDISPEEAEAWRDLPTAQKLNKRYREKFRANGWEFGRTVLNIIRCSACPKDKATDPDLLELKSAIEELLEDDEDGLAATFEDFGL